MNYSLSLFVCLALSALCQASCNKDTSDNQEYEPVKVQSEWSFFEDKELKPAFLQMFRHFKSLSKTQYTVIADIT